MHLSTLYIKVSNISKKKTKMRNSNLFKTEKKFIIWIVKKKNNPCSHG
jgi:hypothetical protein